MLALAVALGAQAIGFVLVLWAHDEELGIVSALRYLASDFSISSFLEPVLRSFVWLATPWAALADLGVPHGWFYAGIGFLAAMYGLMRLGNPAGRGLRPWFGWMVAHGSLAALYAWAALTIVRFWPVPQPLLTPFDDQPKARAEFVEWFAKGARDGMFGRGEIICVLGWNLPARHGYSSGHEAGRRHWQRATDLYWFSRITAITAALRQGDLPHVERWLGSPRVNIDERDGAGRTPLFVLCHTGLDQPGLVRRLIARGADVQARDRGEATPLYQAAYMGRLDVVKALVEAGADVNASAQGYTPLYRAAGVGHLEIVRYLIAQGAAVNAAGNSYRTTPLMNAARSGQLAVARVLLDAGADPNAEGTKGWRALDEAARHDRRGVNPVLCLLLERGADVSYLKNLPDQMQEVVRGEIEACRTNAPRRAPDPETF